MATLTLPTRTDLDNYTIKIALEGTTYQFTFVWNYRSSVWEMSIANGSVQVVFGLPVLVGTIDLLKYVSSPSKPPGFTYAIDTSGNNQEAGLHDLGGRVLLVYQESTGP